MARDDWYDPSAGQVTVSEFGRSWLNERRLADTTRERYEVAFRVQVLPTFGNLAVSSRAAMIYQHISKDRDRHIADGLSAQIESAREDQEEDEVQG